LGASPVSCQFVTELVDEEGPGDAIDKYGRFVGNVRINNVDINLEILRRGWAVVALYNSMRRGEIDECLNASNMGRNTPSGIVKYLTKTIAAFEPDLLYRGKADTEVQQEGREGSSTRSSTVASAPGGPTASTARSSRDLILFSGFPNTMSFTNSMTISTTHPMSQSR
jgi:hypothetical protein